MPSQTSARLPRTAFLASACLCGLLPAAHAQSIFLTPIPNEPFTGTVQTQRSTIQPDGTAILLQSTSSIARDSEGRIHGEFRPLAPAAAQPQPILTIHLYDPNTRISSFLYPQQHTFQVNAINRPPATDTTGPFASATGNSYPQSQFARQEDLGTRTIAGIAAHGVRETQTIPAEASGSGREVLITDEYWYSSELRLNLKIEHNDPRLGSSSSTVVALDRTAPEPGLFTIPADYRSAARTTAVAAAPATAPARP